MAKCKSYGCSREVAEPYWHCCRLCFEAHHDHYPVDEHLPECNLRHARQGDVIVERWARIYEAATTIGPAFEETWRHLQHMFHSTDVGIVDRDGWDLICAQLRRMRMGDTEYMDVFGCPGLQVNLKTGYFFPNQNGLRVDFLG